MAQIAPPPPPNTDGESVVFKKFSGLKNTLKPERLSSTDLVYAKNIDLDDDGQVHRRRGRTLVTPGKFSSLWSPDGKTAYAVKDGALGRVNQDYSFLPLVEGFNEFPQVAWTSVGSTIYYSSSSGNVPAGIIRDDGTVSPWVGPNLGGVPLTIPATRAVASPDYWFSPVANPDPNNPPIGGRLLGPPPVATVLGYYNGRIYLARGRTVWWTELYNYLYVDKTRNFWQFEDEVVMIGVVTDGIYIGTLEGVWWMQGPTAREAKRTRVMDSGVVPGSMVEIPGELANPPQVGLQADVPVKVSIAFMTQEGYCAGQDGGNCVNFTEDRMIFPPAVRAAGLFRRQSGINQYVVTQDSGDTPSSTAAIGDYVDAQLIRAVDRVAIKSTDVDTEEGSLAYMTFQQGSTFSYAGNVSNLPTGIAWGARVTITERDTNRVIPAPTVTFAQEGASTTWDLSLVVPAAETAQWGCQDGADLLLNITFYNTAAPDPVIVAEPIAIRVRTQ